MKWPNFRVSRAHELNLDLGSGHTAYLHHSSTSTYIPNLIEIEKTFCGRTDVRTGGRTFEETHFIRSTRRSRPKNSSYTAMVLNCRYHVYDIIVSDISLKTRCFGLHFCHRMFTCVFNHFNTMRPGSYRIR